MEYVMALAVLLVLSGLAVWAFDRGDSEDQHRDPWPHDDDVI
jgi:hypothetical protein